MSLTVIGFCDCRSIYWTIRLFTTKAGCVPDTCCCFIAYLNWNLIMETPLPHSLRHSDEAFLGWMDKQAKLWLSATWKFRVILFLGRRCGILDGRCADQQIIISVTAFGHVQSVDIFNITLFIGHNSEQRQQEIGVHGQDKEMNSVFFLPSSLRY